MATRAKKDIVTVASFKDTINNIPKTTTFEWNGIEIKVKNKLSFEEMVRFVDAVVGSCYKESTGDYMPENMDIMVRIQIISKYTNISLPKDIMESYDLLYGNNLTECILNNVDLSQYDQIRRSIDAKLKYLLSINTAKVFNDVYDTVKNLNDIGQMFNNLFDGISQDDLNNITQAIVDGKIDEEKLMTAYIENKGKEEITE